MLTVSSFVRSLLLLLLLQSPILPAQAVGQSANPPIKVTLNSGSVISVQLDNDKFTWTDVNQNGDSVEREIAVADIKEVVFTDNPTTDRIAKVLQLLNELSADEYGLREKAEDSLKDPVLTEDFASMIRKFKETAELEARHRIDRILVNISATDQEAKLRLDRLTLNDGQTIKGEFVNLKLVGKFRGQPVSVEREQIVKLSSSQKPARQRVVPQTKTFNQIADFYSAPDQTLVDFSTDPFGNSMKLEDDLESTYSVFGLIMQVAEEGYFIGPSKYLFKSAPIELEGAQCASIHPKSRRRMSFNDGTTEFTFCVPGETANPAGVHRFGLLLEEISHSRDIAVEALDEFGNILGNVEATDQKCCFAGFESNVPIAKVRVRKSPYLDESKLNRELDRNYAFDNVVFSRPVPIDASMQAQRACLKLNNGDLIAMKRFDFELKDDQISFINPLQKTKQIKVLLSEIDAFINHDPHRRQSKKPSDHPQIWMALLNDQSIKSVNIDSDVIVDRGFGNPKIDPEQVICLWPAHSPMRLPDLSKFSEGTTYLAYSSCDIIAEDFKHDEKGFSWNPNSKKIIQNVNLEPNDSPDAEDETDPDFTPQEPKYEFGSDSQRPTIWFRAPPVIDRSVGRVITIDGRHIIFGEKTETQLVGMDRNRVRLKVNGREDSVRHAIIRTIMFPQ